MRLLVCPKIIVAASFLALPLFATAPEPAAAVCAYWDTNCMEVTVQGGLNDSCGGLYGCEGGVDLDSCSYGYCDVEIYDDTGIWGTTTDNLYCQEDWLGNIVCE
jgi:hypothetical protein